MMAGGEDISENLKTDRVTHYVEHPVPIQPPLEEAPAAPMPLMLTQKVLTHTSALLYTHEISAQPFNSSDPCCFPGVNLQDVPEDLQRIPKAR